MRDDSHKKSVGGQIMLLVIYSEYEVHQQSKGNKFTPMNRARYGGGEGRETGAPAHHRQFFFPRHLLAKPGRDYCSSTLLSSVLYCCPGPPLVFLVVHMSRPPTRIDVLKTTGLVIDEGYTLRQDIKSEGGIFRAEGVDDLINPKSWIGKTPDDTQARALAKFLKRARAAGLIAKLELRSQGIFGTRTPSVRRGFHRHEETSLLRRGPVLRRRFRVRRRRVRRRRRGAGGGGGGGTRRPR
ncbi:unnamed protein product [Pylaiella littoralis]